MPVVTVAVLGALIPTAIYVLLVWWLDRYEKEPLWLLAVAFLWGAIPAAILSVLLESLIDIPIYALGGESLATNLLSLAAGAPIIEETAKGIAIAGLVLLFPREFDDVLDGIIYGAMIGFGFAFTENVFAYFIPILQDEGIAAGLVNVFLRTVVFGFNHAFWTAILGAAVGYARWCPGWGRRLLVPLAGWALAVSFHAIHNAGAALADQTLFLSLGFSIVVDWGGVLLLILVAALVLRRESNWIEQGLVEEVRRGNISRQELALLRSASGRLRVRWLAWRRGGRAAYRAVGGYYQCATELAFKIQQLRSHGDERGSLAQIDHLRQQLGIERESALPWLWSQDA